MTSETKVDIGAIGESIVITHLLWHGWSPANLNAVTRNAPNVDILAAKNNQQTAIQVKTSGPSLNARPMMRLSKPTNGHVFNTKLGPIADIVVFVRLLDDYKHECYVVPVDEAERVAKITADDYLASPKMDGTTRNPDFEWCIRFEPNCNRQTVSNYKEKWSHYRDAWHLLDAI